MESTALADSLVQLVFKAQLVILEQLGQLETKEPQAQRGQLASTEWTVSRALSGQLVFREQLDQLGRRATRVIQAQLARLD